MKKTVAVLLLMDLFLTPVFAQQPAGQEKKVVTTPFGNIEVQEPQNNSQNGAPAQPPSTPAQSAPAPGQATPAQAAPVQAAPAQPPGAAPATPAAASPAPAAPQNPTPQTAQPPQQGAAQNAATISLHLDNADIYQVIRIITDALSLSYIIDPAVRGTVNVTTATNLQQSDLLPLLETILRINNATMIKTGNFYQILPSANAARNPLPIQDSSATSNAAGDQMIMQIVRMKFVSAPEMSRVLNPYLSEGANIATPEGSNILLITERRSNLQKLLELVDIFDSNAFEGERVRMMPVKNNLARDLVADLNTVFATYSLSQSTSAIKFIPLDRVNSILAVSPNPAVFDEVEKWLNRLDLPQQTAGRRNYVYKLRHQRVADIQKTLTQLYGISPGGGGQTGTQITPAVPQNALTSQPFAPTAPVVAPNAAADSAAAVQTGGVRIIADSINNALVIQATPQVYAEIERTIQLLDIQPKQVLIDMQVYQVALTDSMSLGVTATLQQRGTLASPLTTASLTGSPATLAAQTFSFIGRARELVMFLNASENKSRVRTLSAPSIIVGDNTEADFEVGAQVPIPTSSSVTPVTSGGSSLFAQTIQYADTGVIMKVKPQINEGGSITLSVNQEISQASANTTSSIQAPVIGKSAVNSTIIANDGETVAISGFIQEISDVGNDGVPFFSRIPGLNALLGNSTKSKNRSELIILITPHVITTNADSDLATDELKRRLTEVKKILQ